MEQFFIDHGLLALFALSFLASSVLPLGSEWLLVALVLQGHDPFPAVIVASVGNYLGACTTYAIGIWGGAFLVKKIVRIDEQQLGRAQQLYQRYGSWSLFFSWLPIIGDPLCLVAGSLGLHFLPFSLLVASGKLARYVAVALLAA